MVKILLLFLPLFLSGSINDFVSFHRPREVLNGIFHTVNLRMGLIQTAAKGKMGISIPVKQPEKAAVRNGKELGPRAVCKANLPFLTHIVQVLPLN